MLNVSLLKKALKVSTLVAAFAVGSATMRADQVTFTGTAMGAFNGGAASNNTTYNTLTYTGSTFNTTSSPMSGTLNGFTYNGYTALGGNPNSGLNNFGAFTLGSSAATYLNTPFELYLTFTTPANISGGQSSNFAATVFGSVSSDMNGGDTITFSPSSQTYTYPGGTFQLNLNNASVNAGSSASVTGYILSNSAVTPEPMSLALLGTGLMGIAFLAYRRSRNGVEAAMPLAF